MSALILIIFGSFLTLAGLVAIAPQVRRHQIDPQSGLAWLFKYGAVALICGQVLAFFMPVDSALVTVSSVIGWASLFTSLAVVSHERRQTNFKLAGSLGLQMFILGAIITFIAFVL